MRKGIRAKPITIPKITKMNLRPKFSPLAYKRYGTTIGQKNIRRKGKARIHRKILSSNFIMPTHMFCYLYARLDTPKRSTPQLLSDSLPK